MAELRFPLGPPQSLCYFSDATWLPTISTDRCQVWTGPARLHLLSSFVQWGRIGGFLGLLSVLKCMILKKQLCLFISCACTDYCWHISSFIKSVRKCRCSQFLAHKCKRQVWWNCLLWDSNFPFFSFMGYSQVNKSVICVCIKPEHKRKDPGITEYSHAERAKFSFVSCSHYSVNMPLIHW